MWTHHQNMRFHTVSAVIALILAVVLRINRYDFLFILVAVFIVIVAEMINTALEEMVNLITTEHRREAKIAKDVASAAVLLSSIFALIVGIVIFLPYVIESF